MHARRLALALVREHLSLGYDVVVGQYLARTDFIEVLARQAADSDASFFEFLLDADVPTLADRLASRVVEPSRAEHLVSNTLVGPADAANGSPSATLGLLRDALR